MVYYNQKEVSYMIEFIQLEYLVAIAENKTISKAAEKLLISQPGLSRSIQRLEEDLGLTLFTRKKNKVELNENGIQAVAYAKNLLAKREEMISELNKLNRKNIIVASCAPAPLWGVVYSLNTSSETHIESHLIQNEESLINGLKQNDYSLIILTHPLDDQDYISQPFLKESLFLSIPPAHPLAPFKEVSFTDLNGQSVLLLSKIGFWTNVCKQYLPDSHLLFQDDPTVFTELTKMSALPNFKSDITIQREPDENNRILIPITDDAAHVQYYAIYPKDKKQIFKSLIEQVSSIDWKKTLNI